MRFLHRPIAFCSRRHPGRGLLSKQVRASAFAALLVLLIATAHAQTRAGAPFRFERPVVPAASGPQRLAIDVPLIAGGSPFAVRPSGERTVAVDGLADLRFFDEAGTEVQYLFVHAPAPQPEWRAGSILPVAATKKTSGFEADFGEPSTMDMIRIGGLPPPFLKRLMLEGSGDRERWTVLVAEGTLFDLPAEQLRQVELPFPAGAYRYLRVTWDDTNSSRVPMPHAVEARPVSVHAAPPPLTAPLTVERRPSEPGRSRYRMKLPGARLPIVAIELQIDGGHVLRDASLFQSRLEGNHAIPAPVGRARIKRVVRDGIAADSLRIPVSGVAEAELELLVEDGANAPLSLSGATAVFAELPWIYLETDGAALVARYGNASLRAPVYDLEAVRDRIDVTRLPEARWGAPRANTLTTSSPLEPALPSFGASIDAAGFRHVRSVPAGDAQLVALVLDAAVLAQSEGPAGSFADVRVLDAENRQIPYLLERRDEPLSIDLGIRPVSDDVAELQADGGNWSSYIIELPHAHLPHARLVVETSGRVFRRRVQVGVEREPDRRRRDRWFDVLASDVWAHADRQNAAAPLTLALPRTPSRTIVLSVDEGDNQPLPITRARLLLPSYRLRFYRPSGAHLRLAYGRDDLAPPRYDLALLTPYVMGVDAREVTAALESPLSSDRPASFVSPRVFWVVLTAAVLVLLAMIARLALREPVKGDAGSPSANATPENETGR